MRLFGRTLSRQVSLSLQLLKISDLAFEPFESGSLFFLLAVEYSDAGFERPLFGQENVHGTAISE